MPLPSPSSLIGILLIAQSSSGPKLVFHYPPNPENRTTFFAIATAAQPSWYGGGSSGTDAGGDGDNDDGWADNDSDSDEHISDDADEETGSKSGRASTRGASGRDREGGGASSRGRGMWGREVEEEQDGDEDEDNSANRIGFAPGRFSTPSLSTKRKTDLRGKKEKGGSAPAWDSVLGFRAEALEKLLTPNRTFNKKKFEIGIEGTVFVGCPMFVREDGRWKKRKRWNKEISEHGKGRDSVTEDQKNLEELMLSSSQAKSTPMVSPDSIVYPPGWEPGYGHGVSSEAASETGSDTKSTSTENSGSEMTMFHVVFLLSPPALEYRVRVKEMYDHVARRYSKALKYEQARHDYVWTESKKILSMKNKGKENQLPISTLWPSIIGSSSLAKSIAITFDSISTSRIADVQLENSFDISFKIPQADWTPYIATATEPQKPGLWLTTVNAISKDEMEMSATRHSALLLLEDKEVLLKEIEGDSKAGSSPLAFYIRNLTPTKSLQKLSIAHSIPSRDIEFIAGHLVYWRRARFIPPLHPRDTYIVSPNCDMRSLQSASPAYALRFPSLPSLAKMLNLLSGSPRPYGSFIPSTDHKAVYMDILAWLMRGGWVTQLRSFAWVRVTPEVKAEVAAAIEMEVQENGEASMINMDSTDDDNGQSSFLSEQHATISPYKRSPNRKSTDYQDDTSNNPLSPRTSTFLSPNRPASDSGSISSGRTAIGPSTNVSRTSSPRGQPVSMKRPSPLHINQSVTTHSATSPSNFTNEPESPSTHTTTPPDTPSPYAFTMHNNVNNNAPRNNHLQRSSSPAHTQLLPQSIYEVQSHGFSSSLVLNPQKASALEARWLECIRQRFTNEDLREAWPILLKYFDGSHALDDIALREGLKRKRVAALLGQIRELGWLVIVRHW